MLCIQNQSGAALLLLGILQGYEGIYARMQYLPVKGLTEKRGRRDLSSATIFKVAQTQLTALPSRS